MISESVVRVYLMLLMSVRTHCLCSSSICFPICFKAFLRVCLASSEVNLIALSLESASLNFFPSASAFSFFSRSFCFSFCFSLSSSAFAFSSFSLTYFFFIQYFLLSIGSVESRGLLSSSELESSSLTTGSYSSSSSSSSSPSGPFNDFFFSFFSVTSSSDSCFLFLNS